jgi:hypothetical protein
MKYLMLAKKHGEDGYLTCWYALRIKGILLHFRSDAFVTEEEEESLQHLHCTKLSTKTLISECSKILQPYEEKIILEALAYIKENNGVEPEKEFNFDKEEKFMIINLE